MTAPLLNASTPQPAAGAAAGLFGAAAAVQGPMAGFEALLTAFFGGQGAGEPALGPDGKPVAKSAAGAAKDAKDAKILKDGADAAESADAANTATPSTDAQILAALLAQPIAAPAPVVTTAEGEALAETPAGGPAAPLFAAPDAAALAGAAQAVKTPDAKAAAPKTVNAGAVAQSALDAEADVAALDAEAGAEPLFAAAAPAGPAAAAAKPAPRQAAAAPPAPEAPAPRSSPPPAALAAAAAATAPPPPPAAAAAAAQTPVAIEAALAGDAAEVAATEPEAAAPAPAAPPRAKAAARAARNEPGAQTGTSATPTGLDAGPLTAAAVTQTETAATFDSGAEGKREDAAPGADAKADVDTGQPVAPNVGDTAAAASTAAPAEMRAGPQTVAHLAAQIVKKLEGRSTQFDVALNPEGLGRVDVRIEIGAQGRLTASMSFENPQAAAELRTRAGELQKALEQAGFDVSGGIRFDVAADRGQGQAGQGQFGQDFQNNGGASRGRAFQAALENADQSAEAALSGALTLQRRTLVSGVDVRI